MTATTRIAEESRRERTVALLLSVLIHLLLIGGIAWILLLPDPVPAPAAPAEEPMSITIMPPEPVPDSQPQFVRTNPAAAQEKAPENAQFESDNNTIAASEAAPTGDAALPSLEGMEAPTLELENQNYTAGSEARPAAPAEPPAPEQPLEQTAEPMATPVPMPQLALREAPQKPPEERPKPQESTQPKPVARPQPPSAPAFQPETRVTRIRGNISNRGKAAVAAASTPLGRYKKMISDAIGSRWYYYVNNQIGLLNIGTVDIRFIVLPDGKVRDIRVTSNSSNESFAAVSVSSIVDAEIPPIPEDVAKLLENGRIEIDYSFTILSN